MSLPPGFGWWESGNENYGRLGGRLDGSIHEDRQRTKDQKFEAIVRPLRGDLPCPTCGRGMKEAA
jgi:hypothetical protein